MDKPCCRTCYHRRVFHWNRGTRRQCYCQHPDAEKAFKESGATTAVAFISFTFPGSAIPAIKTAPRWCPLRKMDGDEEKCEK